MNAGVALYSAVDDMLTHYAVDVDAGVLTERESVKLPAKVQYAWPHPSRKVLYVSTSDGGPRVPSHRNHVSAYAVAGDGTLTPHGEPRTLPRRAVHMCVHPSGHYVLNAHNFPASGVTVHEIGSDGRLGAEVEQRQSMDYGIYPHQVMVFASGRSVLVVDRGNKAQGEQPEQPGALRTFGFEDGALSPGQVIAPGGGFGFGPRHVAFHPSMPWLYVSDERTNRLYMFRIHGDAIDAKAAYTRELLAEPRSVKPRQLAGAIHVHPSGRFVYVANRADHSIQHGAGTIFGGGENSIAVFAIDADSGEPTLVQHAATHSFHVRTFACDPSGRLLVTASIKPHAVLSDGEVTAVPAALSVFRIADDGRLEFVRKYAVRTEDNQLQYWMGMVGRAAHDGR